jgi:hypothetical protein
MVRLVLSAEQVRGSETLGVSQLARFFLFVNPFGVD